MLSPEQKSDRVIGGGRLITYEVCWFSKKTVNMIANASLRINATGST